MSFIASRTNFTQPFALTGDIKLYVTDAGADTNSNRIETSGDLAGKPFLTIAGALNYLPTNHTLNGYTATINYSRTVSESVNAYAYKNGSLVLNGSVLAASTFQGCDNLSLTNINGTAKVSVIDCSGSNIGGTFSNNGWLFLNGGSSTVKMSASSCTNTVLKAQYMPYLGYSVAANNCTATPIDLNAVQYSEIVGTGVSGTNSSASYGIRLSGGGKHVLTGCTLASSTSNVLDLDGYGVSWSALSVENHFNAGTYAFWSDNLWVNVGRFRIFNNSSQDFDDFITRDLQYGRFFKQYGLNRPLDPAYKEVTAFSGGGQGSATVVGLQDTVVTAANANGDSIRLLNTSDNSGLGGGAKGSIWNRTNKSVNLFPPSGHVLYSNGSSLGTNNSYTMSAGSKVFWLCDNNNDFNIG